MPRGRKAKHWLLIDWEQKTITHYNDEVALKQEIADGTKDDGTDPVLSVIEGGEEIQFTVSRDPVVAFEKDDREIRYAKPRNSTDKPKRKRRTKMEMAAARAAEVIAPKLKPGRKPRAAHNGTAPVLDRFDSPEGRTYSEEDANT